MGKGCYKQKGESNHRYPYSLKGGVMTFETKESLIKGIPKANPGYKCPKCGTQAQGDKKDVVGMTPMTTNEEKYPGKDVPYGHTWEEVRQCVKCQIQYWLTNGD
jgi:hypothetical protein